MESTSVESTDKSGKKTNIIVKTVSTVGKYQTLAYALVLLGIFIRHEMYPFHDFKKFVYKQSSAQAQKIWKKYISLTKSVL